MAQTLSPSGGAFGGFGAVGVVKQLGLLIGLAASVAIGVALALWGSAKDYRPLDGNFPPAELLQVDQLLTSKGIAHQLDAASGLVLVESGKINQARMELASAGLMKTNNSFDRLQEESPLGSSQFMETARYRHALESELAKTITSISGVRNARVHIAMPQRSAFIRDQREPSASVFIERSGGRSIDGSQVKAIENLVASSIPEMSPKNVTVVDQYGSLLSSRDEDPEISVASRQLDYTREVEKTLLQRVNNLLVPLVGEGKFKAEISADIDFTVQEQADEIYDDAKPAVRSEQVILEQRGGSDAAAGIPGALSNQPPPTGAAPEVVNGAAGAATDSAVSANSSSRKQDVRNFELDRTVSYTKQQTGRIKRLTVAVVVDHQTGADAATTTPWDSKDLETLSILVRGAVGYSEPRGDSVNVINRSFAPVAPLEEISVPLWEQPWLIALVKPLVSGLVLLVLILGLLRPVLKRLAEVPPPLAAPMGLELAGAAAPNNAAMMLPSPESGYENQLTSVKGLVAQDSERVAQVIKQWISEDQS